MTENDPKHALDRKRFAVEVITACLLLLYVTIAAFQWCEMRRSTDNTSKTLSEVQKQTTLMRQQLEGTMSAVVTFQEPRITPDPVTRVELLVIALPNRGHVTAPEAHASFQIDTVSFPDLTATLESKTETIVTHQLVPGGAWGQNYALPGFTQRELQFTTQRKTITVKGTFGYDNGFGSKFEEPICYSFIGSYNIKNEDAGSTSGGGGFFPCEGFEEKVSYISKHLLK
jgi:hypothetical protein